MSKLSQAAKVILFIILYKIVLYTYILYIIVIENVTTRYCHLPESRNYYLNIHTSKRSRPIVRPRINPRGFQKAIANRSYNLISFRRLFAEIYLTYKHKLIFYHWKVPKHMVI